MELANIHYPLVDEKITKIKALKLLSEVEELLKTKLKKKSDKELLYNFLKFSRESPFLVALETVENRKKWANLTFDVIRKIDFSFLNLFEQRVNSHPEKILFLEKINNTYRKWTYKQIYVHTQEIAAFIYKLKPEKPRVAILMQNSIETASIDIACLSYDIFVTPFNVHLTSENLEYIFTLLDFDFIITDSNERLKIAEKAIKNSKKDITLIATKKDTSAKYFLSQECKKITQKQAVNILNKRTIKPLNQVATTMFTSGSTGLPKGVSFSNYNIVSKRFARAAALPQVGVDEKLVCYLPLFHTFGRFLEMTGTIFWGGTYVMANNPSIDSLMKIFKDVNPTGFISVPMRWIQMYDMITSSFDKTETEEEIIENVRHIAGKNLHWGLSAAGYLDPKIFKFFHKYGISVNSGFGMTEATGGITMTPSFEYEEGSVGIPLPGMETRLTKNNELELKGHYLAKYLDVASPDDIIPYPEDEDYWLPTGDIFNISDDGHHEIVDRVKDIYKNNKGQTISPRITEQKFDGVPGIKRAFLVGDGRPYNVLLIVPDKEDPVLTSINNEDNKQEYFHQIVTTANTDLAPYERVINFAVIDRNFSIEENELTAKGSYKRKNIEKNFSTLIKTLYITNHVSFFVDDYEIVIPRWFYRDISVLETDIQLTKQGLYNRISNKTLTIRKSNKNKYFVIGNLAYFIKDKIIDLGRIIRQPKLWVGNPELTNFTPCKANYDIPLKNISQQFCIPEKPQKLNPADLRLVKGVRDEDLVFLDNMISIIMHCDTKIALQNLKQLEMLFTNYEKDKVDIIKRRLESLACHDEEKIRILAYQILISVSPDPDYSKYLPAFINSGKTFLDEKSILKIAKSNIDNRQLQAYRQRMHAYRTGLKWPANENTREQFDKIFKLLLNFGKNNPKYYKSLRAEFASWTMMKNEPILAEQTKKYFQELHYSFESEIAKQFDRISTKAWDSFFVFDDGILPKYQDQLKEKLKKNNFLKLSVFMTYDDFDFAYKALNKNSIRISRLKNYRSSKHYRMSINTSCGKHFDIHISINNKLNSETKLETIYYNIALSGFPYDSPAIAQFGYANPQNKIYTTRYISQLSAWDKIRSLAESQGFGYIEDKNFWRKIFIRSISVFYKAWSNLNREILPGFLSPENVVVPEVDFSDNVRILSLSGLKKCSSSAEFLSILYKNFYQKTTEHYPSLNKSLKISWLFHSLVETFGKKESVNILISLIDEIDNKNKPSKIEQKLLKNAKEYLKSYHGKFYLPLALFNAVDSYTHWQKSNKSATTLGQMQTIDELFELYKLSKYPEIIRYEFYRETYFANAEDNVKLLFDKLLKKMFDEPESLAIQLIELSDLQSELNSDEDIIIFNKMVFPDIKDKRKVDLRKIGEKKSEHIIVSSTIKDRKNEEYSMREPIDPSEVGEVYKLFFKENYPKEISKMDKYYVVINQHDQVIGGLCYKELENNIVLIDGMAVTSSLQARGIGSRMMTDFFSRMKAKGFKMVKAHFLFGNYYLKHNFKIDKEWGALVREL